MIRIKNVADSPRGIHALTGFVLIEAGKEADVELSPAERSGLGSYFEVVREKKAEKPAPSSEGGEGGEPSLVAKHRGGGSYSVMDGDTEVVQGLDKDAAHAFNALDAQGKAAFVAERRAAA